MAKKSGSKKAKFLQALVYVDQPHLILLQTEGFSLIVAVAVNAEGYDDAYYGVEISKDQFIDFLREKFDLLYLFKKPSFKRWYLLDAAKAVDSIVTLDARMPTDELESSFFPGAGIFARELTEEINGDVLEKQDTEKFLIDGKWDLPEFSQFYGKYTDLYVMMQSVDIFLDQQADIDQRRKVQEAFIRPWQGGGSYGAAYDSLLSVQNRYERLHVDAIQYASPGYVDIKGNEDIFNKTRLLIEGFSQNEQKIAKEYRVLHKFLSETKLLTTPSNKFEREGPLAAEISDRARKFSETLGAVDFDVLMNMAGKDQLIVAKVLLSIQRRLAKLNEFFLEGRVSF